MKHDDDREFGDDECPLCRAMGIAPEPMIRNLDGGLTVIVQPLTPAQAAVLEELARRFGGRFE